VPFQCVPRPCSRRAGRPCACPTAGKGVSRETAASRPSGTRRFRKRSNQTLAPRFDEYGVRVWSGQPLSTGLYLEPRSPEARANDRHSIMFGGGLEPIGEATRQPTPVAPARRLRTTLPFMCTTTINESHSLPALFSTRSTLPKVRGQSPSRAMPPTSAEGGAGGEGGRGRRGWRGAGPSSPGQTARPDRAGVVIQAR
jgi:hypothetical protein